MVHFFRAPFRTIALIALTSMLGSCAPTPSASSENPVRPAVPPTTIIITRHAEKKVGSADPDLSEAGLARAAALAEAIKPFPVTATLATRTRRAQQTAQPTIEAFKIPLDRAFVVAPSTSARDLKAMIVARPPGEAILVVSHSNVVPELVREFGFTLPFEMTEADYDKVVVIEHAPGKAVLKHAGPLPFVESAPPANPR